MPHSILLIDDHPLFRDGMRHVLAQFDESLEVVLSEDCEAATQIATSREDLDLVLMDINLASENGLRCLTRFRANFPLLPVIMLSASEDTSLVNEALREGAQGYIPKSSTTEVMLNAIRLVLGGGVYVPKQALIGHSTSQASTENSAFHRPQALSLTPRQREVLQLLALGKSNKEIARLLEMSDGTARVHVTAILRALGVVNRTQAGMAAMRYGLLSDDQ